jgi:hypothetical protein
LLVTWLLWFASLVAITIIKRENKGASKNSEFAQMQGAEKIPPRRICIICKQEIFSATQQLG